MEQSRLPQTSRRPFSTEPTLPQSVAKTSEAGRTSNNYPSSPRVPWPLPPKPVGHPTDQTAEEGRWDLAIPPKEIPQKSRSAALSTSDKRPRRRNHRALRTKNTSSRIAHSASSNSGLPKGSPAASGLYNSQWSANTSTVTSPALTMSVPDEAALGGGSPDCNFSLSQDNRCNDYSEMTKNGSYKAENAQHPYEQAALWTQGSETFFQNQSPACGTARSQSRPSNAISWQNEPLGSKAMPEEYGPWPDSSFSPDTRAPSPEQRDRSLLAAGGSQDSRPSLAGMSNSKTERRNNLPCRPWGSISPVWRSSPWGPESPLWYPSASLSTGAPAQGIDNSLTVVGEHAVYRQETPITHSSMSPSTTPTSCFHDDWPLRRNWQRGRSTSPFNCPGSPVSGHSLESPAPQTDPWMDMQSRLKEVINAWGLDEIYGERGRILREALHREAGEAIRARLLRELEAELREEMQMEAEADLRKSIQVEMESDLRKEVQVEIEQGLRARLYDEMGSELQKKTQGELEAAIREEIELWMGAELQGNIQREIESEIRKDIQLEMGPELKTRIQGEIESKMGEEIQLEMGSDLRNRIQGEIESDLRETFFIEMGEMLRKQIQRQLEIEIKAEVRQEMDPDYRLGIRQELEIELRELVRKEEETSLVEKVRNELEQEVRQTILREIEKEFRDLEQAHAPSCTGAEGSSTKLGDLDNGPLLSQANWVDSYLQQTWRLFSLEQLGMQLSTGPVRSVRTASAHEELLQAGGVHANEHPEASTFVQHHYEEAMPVIRQQYELEWPVIRPWELEDPRDIAGRY